MKNMLRPLSPHLKSSLRHLIISFIILSPVMFSAYLFFDLIGLNPDLILLKLKAYFFLHELRSIFRLFGLDIPIFVLLSIVGSIVGSSLHMMDPAGGQPAANPAAEQPSNVPSGASTSGWRSFEERVLLEPDSSSSSVNGPSNTEADESAQTSGDQNMDPEELLRKKVELHTLVREQLRHYCERGRPKWQLSNSAEMRENYSRGATHIISSLEIGPTISEHQCWIDHLRSNPTTLYELYKEYR